MNKNIHSTPVIRHGKKQAIGTNWIVIMGNMRRLRVLRSKFIIAVHIYGDTIALKFPVRGDFNFFPVAVIVARLPEIRRGLGWFWDPVKLPAAIKRLIPGGIAGPELQCLIKIRERNKSCMRQLGIYGKNLWIFPIVNYFLGVGPKEVTGTQQNKKE